MNLSGHIAKHFRDVHFGGNWTTSNLRDNLADVSWEQATTQVSSFNTMLKLVYHTGYYVSALLRVLEGEALNAKDEYSFDHPQIKSEEDWQELLNKTWRNAEDVAQRLEQLPESKWWEDFTDKKYGNYYRNVHGIIEHLHYHLGQIVIIKKLVLQNSVEGYGRG